MRRKTFIVACIAMLLIVVSAIVPGILDAKRNDLTQNASKITDTTNWAARYAHGLYWISNDGLVALCNSQHTPKTTFLVANKTYHTGGEITGGQYIFYDLHTHRTIPLDALTEELDRTICRLDTINLSPDGQLLMWTGRNQTFVSDLHVTKVVARENLGDTVWEFQHGYWFDVVWDDDIHISKLVERSYQSPAYSRVISDSGAKQFCCSIPVLSPENNLIVSAWEPDQASVGTVDTMMVPVNGLPHDITKNTIHLPQNTRCKRVIVSPNGRKIAWILISDKQPSLFSNIGFSLFHKHNIRTMLWVSDFRGANMHEMGFFPNTLPEELGGNVKWLPDSERISFICNNALYITKPQ